MEIMRGQAVAPQQYVGFARYERKTGVGEDAADGRETTAEAIERRKIIGIVGFQLRRGAVGIRRRLARDNSTALPASRITVARPAVANAARRVCPSDFRRNGCSTNRQDRYEISTVSAN